ncbi:BatA domain-containing protein [Caulobacter sp. SL161]|uniref:BatA domain-containing protein n=1 Tax=Caulobacter sp. SL161 TaxID=2995156 RepID=UPI002275E2A0|nr:BatA domain-containing protein [Caulobacter sp. SL161]MCY1648749.1 BatA domain-containing protein [Caulobacter sp. SL161]
MIPALLLPAALAALLAVAVPLAIHIARRTETRTIDFAALRWLNPNPKPVQRLQLDERLLLAVRIALIVAIAVALARPVLRPSGDERPVVALAPGIDAAQVPDDAARRVWLAPDFPSADHAAPPATADLASLIRQLDAELPAATPLTLVVPQTFEADGGRLVLSRKVTWKAVPTTVTPSAKPERAPPALAVRYAAERVEAVQYFRAAASAYAESEQTPAFDAAPVDQPLPGGAQTLIWLSGAPLSDAVLSWIERGGVVLLADDAPSPVEGSKTVVWRDAVAEPLALEGRYGQGRVLQLTRPLAPKSLPALVEPDFPDRLWTLLDPPPAPARVAAQDYTPTLGEAGPALAFNPHPIDLRPWLAVLIAALFAGERWLATRRNRAVMA